MRVIGMTGGIATGKSTVAEMLRIRGAAVIDADELAREVVRPGSTALAEIVAGFGRGVLRPDGEVDRARLADVVFANEAMRLRLEEITHPRIRALMASGVAAAVASDPPIVVVDIPLLYERPRALPLDGVLLIDCSPEIQLQRLMERDGIDAAAARLRIAAQLPAAEKRKRATWIVDNDGPVGRTEQQVDAWWRSVVAVPRNDPGMD